MTLVSCHDTKGAWLPGFKELIWMWSWDRVHAIGPLGGTVCNFGKQDLQQILSVKFCILVQTVHPHASCLSSQVDEQMLWLEMHVVSPASWV